MKAMIIIFCFLTLNLFAQNQNRESHIISEEIKLQANVRTKIFLYNRDSTETFILFDNIITKPEKLVFIFQPNYYEERNKYKDAIVLPFPLLKSDLYYIKFVTKDTSYVKKFLFMQ